MEWFVLFSIAKILKIYKIHVHIGHTWVSLRNVGGRIIYALSLSFKNFKEVHKFGHIQIWEMLQ